MCLPLNGGRNIWLPEGALIDFTPAKYGECTRAHDGLDTNQYFVNPRPIAAVGLSDLVDTSNVEAYYESKKSKKTVLTIPKDLWDNVPV